MHDLRYIRENPDDFDAALARRGVEAVAQHILALDEQSRALKTRLQDGQARRNEASKAIGKAKGQGDEETAQELMAEVSELKTSLPVLEEKERQVSQKLREMLANIPNLPADDVPDGADEHDNVEILTWGEPRTFDFEPREHADFAPALGMDFESGTRVSGARFTFLRGDMARLHRALGQYMIDQQTRERGYIECNPPVLVNDDAMYGTDKLPKFAEDSFETDLSIHPDTRLFWELNQLDEMKTQGLVDVGAMVSDPDVRALMPVAPTRRWLIPTAEVSLTSSVMGEILAEADLPMRLTALTLCFRSEAGSAGRDTRGFIRQHQFEKCELVSIVRPEDSEAEHGLMTNAAESILQSLKLPYRKVELCTGDLGFGARKTYDLEVWLPGQGAYREISSCSNTGDFQARRMNARFRRDGETKGTEFVHTLNGSGLAVGRTLVAVLENYQQEDGSVAIPQALLPYMGGIDKLEPV